MATTYGPMGNPFGGRGPSTASPQGFGPGPATPGFDATTINAALQPYGVSMPESYSAPGPAENTSWGQQHSRLSRGIDNALIAVGGMGPGGPTAGENISNAVRGVMGVEPFRRQYMSEQAMLPFQYAKEVGGLQAQQSYMKMQNAMGAYYGDRGTAALQANEQKLQGAQIRANIQGALKPRLNKDASGEFVEIPQVDDNFQTTWQRTNIDPSEFRSQEAKGKFANRFGQSAQSEFVGNTLANHYGSWDKIPDVLDSSGLKVWQQAIRDSSPQVFDASLSRVQNQDNAWHSEQRDLIAKYMPQPKMSATDLKAFTTQAEGEAKAKYPDSYAQRKGYVADAIKNREMDLLKAHDQFMTHASAFTSLSVDDQRRMGGIGGYLQMLQGTQTPGTATPEASAPTAPNPNPYR